MKITTLGEIVKVQAAEIQPREGKNNWLLNLDMVEQQTGKIIAYNKISKDELQGSIISFDTKNVLYSKLRPNLNKVVCPQQEGYATSEMLPLRIIVPNVSREYLTCFLRSDSFVKWAVNRVAGAKMPRLSTKELMKKEIPIPSIQEQEKIVNQFQLFEKSITQYQELLQNLDTLVKSRFVEMFGDLAFNPKKWQEEKIVDVCENNDDIKCGPFGTQLNKDEYVRSGVPVWEIPQINSYFHKPAEDFVTIEKANELSSYSLEEGDIAMSRKGNVGRCAIYPTGFPKGIIHSDVLRIRVDKKICNPVFLMCQLHFSRAIETQINLVSNGAIMAGINVTKLKNIMIYVPPIELQNEFANFVQQVDATKQSVTQSIETLQTLKASLMQKYFH